MDAFAGLLGILAVFGFITAVLARRKGESSIVWFALGAFSRSSH
jgi:hypothetical protein